jgi:hypothetical protein
VSNRIHKENGKRFITRRQVSRLLLTISQVEEFDKEKIKEKLVKKYGENINYCCISREEHRDKGVHCHIFIHFKKRVKISYSPNTFEFLFNKAVNIQQVKQSLEDRKNALRYVKKVQDYIEFGKSDVTDLTPQDPRKINPEKYIMKMIKEGIEYERLATHEIEKVQHYALKHSNQIKRIMFELENAKHWKEKQKLKGIRLIDKGLIEANLAKEEKEMIEKDSGLQKIIEHINNIMVYKWNRPFKMKNLLIWSKGVDKGKTSLIRKIMEYSPMYGFPRDQWFQGYISNRFWGILWNEMTLVGIDIDMLKNFLEGTPVKLSIKGSSVNKEDNPEVLMTSNVNLKTMIERKYGNESNEMKEIHLNALKARIEEVNVDQYKNIFFLSKLIIPISDI